MKTRLIATLSLFVLSAALSVSADVPMNQIEASQFCREKGSRLPTARELAEFSIRRGAKGIQEEATYDGDTHFYLIRSLQSDGTSDNFYFSQVGYKLPDGDSPKNWVWSSSVHPDYLQHPFMMNADNGAVFIKAPANSIYYKFLPRCMPLL